MAERPGIMIYKDTAPAIMQMDDAKAGQLFKAILLADEEEPVFDDPELRLAWAFIYPRIQEDAARYRTISEKRKAAGKKGANASKCQQVPANVSQLNTEQLNTEQLKSTRSKESQSPTRHKYGEYLNVFLSDDDLTKLKAEFPTDWQQRIERLSEYMASSGKSYKNHFATIRRWARDDKPKHGIELGGGLVCSL